MGNTASDMLSPEMQDAFWGALDPDMRNFLSNFEALEEWTWQFEEMPDLFIQVARALPAMVELPPTEETREILRDLIPLLAAMPLRQAIAAIIWLDNRAARDPRQPGWGVVCYREAAAIAFDDLDDSLYAEAKTIYERIHMMMQSRIAASLFCRLHKEVKQ